MGEPKRNKDSRNNVDMNKLRERLFTNCARNLLYNVLRKTGVRLRSKYNFPRLENESLFNTTFVDRHVNGG